MKVTVTNPDEGKRGFRPALGKHLPANRIPCCIPDLELYPGQSGLSGRFAQKISAGSSA